MNANEKINPKKENLNFKEKLHYFEINKKIEKKTQKNYLMKKMKKN